MKTIRNNRKKGALTIEACVSLTVYIFAMLALSYIIQSYYVENLMDAATATVMQDLAGKAYYLDQFGVIEATDAIAERTKDISPKIRATVERAQSMYDDAKYVKDDIFSFNIGEKGKEMISAFRSGNIIKGFQKINGFREELVDDFEDSFARVRHGMKTGKATLKDGIAMSKDLKGVGISLVETGISKGIQFLLAQYILTQVRMQLGERAELYRIRELEIDMGENGLLYKDTATELDRLITVNIRYKVAIPLFIAPEVEMKRTIRKTVRAWIGE